MTIEEFFQKNNKAAIAFSGGVDSAYLLCAAVASGADVSAYYVRTAFQPEWEYADAERIAKLLGAKFRCIDADVLSVPDIASNPANRCYYCKKLIMGTIASAAEADGYPLILDGTNASDDVSDRPGMKALAELGIRSPLRECGLSKDEIRERSREAGLFTWNKPAYACLATRIAHGEIITPEKLRKTEEAEDFLASLGCYDFRVRMMGNKARLELRRDDFDKVIGNRAEIIDFMNKRYDGVLLDLEARDE